MEIGKVWLWGVKVLVAVKQGGTLAGGKIWGTERGVANPSYSYPPPAGLVFLVVPEIAAVKDLYELMHK